VHALHRGVFLVVEDYRHDRQVVIARRAEATEHRVVEERAVADQRYDGPFRFRQLDPQRKTQPLSETALAGEQALRLVPYEEELVDLGESDIRAAGNRLVVVQFERIALQSEERFLAMRSK